MVREKPADQRCQHNGEKCCQKINGKGAWQYCSECRKAALKEAKKERDRNYRAKRREGEADRAEDNFYHFLYNHRLTENQLEPLLKKAETVQEEYSCKDDFHEDVLADINKIRCTLIYPLTDLPGTAQVAEKRTLNLLNTLKRQQDSCPNLDTEHLIAYTSELLRDIGKRIASTALAFTEISGKAKEVLEMWRAQKEIRGFIYALFVYVELNRLKFLAMPDRRRFLIKARTWLAAAEHLCDLSLSRSIGSHKQAATFLNFYASILEITLVFDAGEPENAAGSVQSLQDRATAVADSCGKGLMSETSLFLSAIHQAEYHMKLKKPAPAQHHFKEAERIFNTMQQCSIEAQLELAYVKAGLALETNRQSRHEDVQEYLILFQRHPFLTHYTHLQELKGLYPHDVPDVPMLKTYIDTMFRELQPILLPV